MVPPVSASAPQAFDFLPFLVGVSFEAEIFSARTCFTHFCSSMRKARITRVRVHPAQREPPYGRFTRRSRFFRRLYSTGRRQGTPMIALPQSPHFGPFAFFCTWWYTSLP